MQAVEVRVTEIFACPNCGAQRDAPGKSLRCSCCWADYPVGGGMPDFAPWTVKPICLGQRFMEDRRVISIYGTRLWRASLLFRLFTGIRIDDGIELVSRILAPGPEDIVLDVSCGTGLFARSFALGHPARPVIGLGGRYAVAAFRRSESAFIGGVQARFDEKVIGINLFPPAS